MTNQVRIYVPLSLSEYRALRSMAEVQDRNPRLQARRLICQGLGMTEENANRGAVVESEPQRAAVAK